MKSNFLDFIITCSVFGLLFVLTLSAIIIAVKIDGVENSSLLANSRYNNTEVIVQPGDTLWSIAQAQVPNEDPRDVVDSIKKLNQLKSADIFPGQVLQITVKQNVQLVQNTKEH